jgi:hypothetical protein
MAAKIDFFSFSRHLEFSEKNPQNSPEKMQRED